MTELDDRQANAAASAAPAPTGPEEARGVAPSVALGTPGGDGPSLPGLEALEEEVAHPRPRPEVRRPAKADLGLLVSIAIAVAVLVAIIVGLVVSVHPNPNTNGTVYRNDYHVFSNGS